MRHKSEITKKGYGKGRPSKNRGKRFYADTLTREEVLSLVDGNNCGPSGLRDRALIVLLWRTGLRISEACNLRLHDLDLERRTIRVRGTKTRTSDRTVGMSPMVYAHVRDWLDVRQKIGIPPVGFVFCCISRHEKGNPVKPAQARQKLHHLAAKAGLSKRVHPHCLRHSFAAELATERVDIRVISAALGRNDFSGRRDHDFPVPRTARTTPHGSAPTTTVDSPTGQAVPDSRILICLGPCHGEFYYPLGDGERIGCPTDATHPVAVYEAPTVHQGEPEEEDDDTYGEDPLGGSWGL